MDCASCHTTDSWELDFGSFAFDHDSTAFSLTGQHTQVDCRQCHTSLVFEEASQECMSCHMDMHQGTVGMDCARCHDTRSWLVDNITELHQQAAFALVGMHATANCYDCHTSESELRFEPIGNGCINCHREDYNATTNPDHETAGFSTDCAQCHNVYGTDWTSDGFNHNFFPLTKGHAIEDCAQCHAGGDYSNTPTDCFACHEQHFEATTNPGHESAGFTTDCASCHTTDPDWMPAEFLEHDALHFPVYSGAHRGTWSNCAECHTDPDNFATFSCTTCHAQADTDDEHDEVDGYTYSSPACLACHPTGDEDGAFDHNATNFPLTGAHTGVECISCHAAGYTGTSTVCADCHGPDYDASTNPSHTELGLPMDCASCHTTDPEWNPAAFPDHDAYYELLGAHALIANDCAACHNGDYTNTPNTCFGCHASEYNSTTDPDHADAQFSTDCATCHNQASWVPSTFDHDAQYFPVYSGEHAGAWSQCAECHTTPGDYTVFTCVTCHANPETDDEHAGVNGYVYNSPACLACHPTGDADIAFDHNATDFPLTGAHTIVDCISCHAGGYAGTSTLCADCHTPDYEQTANPGHTALGLSTDCAACHTTAPDWNPAAFPEHDAYYALQGAHAAIANDCASCHNGDYINTPATCFGCHSANYAQTTDPDHVAAQFSTDCATCHSENAWTPSTFDHDAQYFPVYSGAHAGEWSQCAECHTTPGDYTVVTCVTCHANPETDEEHAGVNGYVYNSPACLACHPTGDADVVFDHNTTAFPLTGAHTVAECISCHAAGYEGTSTLCADCHNMDYAAATNPNHGALGLSMDCAACHTTDPGWEPAAFPDHNEYYVLNGAHAALANDCAACHTGDYNNTPSTCVGCHQADYDQTTNPSHLAAQFSTDCASCHNENAWVPSTFDHDAQYFPIYSGAHNSEWSECIDCHTNPSDHSVFTCTTCHANPETDNLHPGVNGYAYNSIACLGCHPTGDADMPFDHNNTAFPLTGAHLVADCIDCHAAGFAGTSTVCVDCHQADYNQSTNPPHGAVGISTDCAACHTTDPDWMPAAFPQHEEVFAFTGAHVALANDCAACHGGNYINTPSTCAGCHQADYNQSVNPDHGAIGIPNDCAMCHTTDPDWNPATFPIHDEYYVLEGAHLGIANDCAACHNGDYTSTPNTCYGCHQADYEQTTDPDHVAAQFSTDCASCHTQDAWSPATFDHDEQYFPIYSGTHDGVWSQCSECHTNPGNFAEFTCVTCHGNPETDNAHVGINAYAYNSPACLACHPTGDADMAFDHNTTAFPLTGAHVTVDCIDCHASGYAGTSTICADCHQTDYNQTTNPNHIAVGIPNDCAMCHTTDPGWAPAEFPNHDNYYALTGAHTAIANDCAACHNGDYNNTPNTCAGCHQADYNQAADPNHVALGLPNDCAMCHTTDPGWSPADFPIHDNYYVLTGAHVSIANDCAACHSGGYNNTPNTCAGCHQADYNQAADPNHVALGIPNDCAMCHTTDPGWSPADFPIHDNYYALTGAHATIANDCAMCHSGGYNNTPSTCVGCHQADYNQAAEPDHSGLGIPTDCAMCHTTDPGWSPADFPIHDNYYALTGAHATIANDCAMCHSGGYNNTPSTCVGCHQADYNQAAEPDHSGLGIPTDCAMCHTTDPDWNPATFPIHDDYYVLVGAHAAIANDCAACHSGGYSNTPNTCYGCHQTDYEQTIDPDHQAAMFPTDCASCHSENAWTPATFDHDNMYFPIYSGKHDGEWNQCSDCHFNPTNYSEFDCLGCHPPGETAEEHDEVPGYVYNSMACFNCHPDGED